MRVIPIWDEAGQLRPDAMGEILVHTYFSEGEDSRAQAMMLWRSERARADAMGEWFRFSDLVHVVLTSLERKVPGMTLAGNVALVMLLMGQFGHPMHLKRAAGIVSDFVYRPGNDRVIFRPMVGTASDIRDRKASGDLQNIEEHFRTYRSVAHLLAAGAAVSGHAAPGFRHGFDHDPEYAARFIRTAMHFEHRLSAAPTFPTWNTWSVAAGAPPEAWAYPPTFLSFDRVFPVLGEELFAAITGAEIPPRS